MPVGGKTVVRSSFLLLCLFLGLSLGACAGSGWPDLGKVQRPAGSDSAGDAGAENADAAGAAPAAAPASAEVVAALAALTARAEAAEAEIDGAYAAYLEDLRRVLAAPATAEALTARWSAAQAALSRVATALAGLRQVRDDMAAYATSAGRAGTPSPEIAAALDHVVALHAGRSRALDLEANRLGVLTPVAVGAPGPAAVHDSTRTALATMRFAGAKPQLEQELAAAITAVRKTVPDVAFDAIATGPAASVARQQAALRAVMQALWRLDVPPAQLALALARPEGEGAEDSVTVRLYVKNMAP